MALPAVIAEQLMKIAQKEGVNLALKEATKLTGSKTASQAVLDLLTGKGAKKATKFVQKKYLKNMVMSDGKSLLDHVGSMMRDGLNEKQAMTIATDIYRNYMVYNKQPSAKIAQTVKSTVEKVVTKRDRQIIANDKLAEELRDYFGNLEFLGANARNQKQIDKLTERINRNPRETKRQQQKAQELILERQKLKKQLYDVERPNLEGMNDKELKLYTKAKQALNNTLGKDLELSGLSREQLQDYRRGFENAYGRINPNDISRFKQAGREEVTTILAEFKKALIDESNRKSSGHSNDLTSAGAIASYMRLKTFLVKTIDNTNFWYWHQRNNFSVHFTGELYDSEQAQRSDYTGTRTLHAENIVQDYYSTLNALEWPAYLKATGKTIYSPIE